MASFNHCTLATRRRKICLLVAAGHGGRWWWGIWFLVWRIIGVHGLGPQVTPSHLLHLLSRWSLPLYKARAGAQQGRRHAKIGSRLVGWCLMCGGLSEVAEILKAEAERQHYHLVGVLGQKITICCVKSFVGVFSLLVRRTVITGTGYFAQQHSLRMPNFTQSKKG
jgi:hypothetical protein